MDVHVKVDTLEIERRAVAVAKTAEREELDKQLRNMFYNGSRGGTEGVGHMQIREKIEAELERVWDSEKMIAEIERKVPALVSKYVEEAIHEIAKHRARKIAFYEFNEYLKNKGGD